jgi:flavodoxin
MKKVLIAYFSSGGETQKMAEYIAEGVRFSGNQALTRKIVDIKNAKDLAGYDGYIFGSPTFSQDTPGPVNAFLKMAAGADLEGKLGGAFGSYRHDVGYSHDKTAPAIILDSMEKQLRLKPFELGPFALKEDVIDTAAGVKACQDYGRVFGDKVGEG